MRRRMIAPVLLLMTSAAPPLPEPVDLSGLMQYCGGKPSDEPSTGKVVLLPGYGQGGFPIRSASPEAAAFFQNGMQLGHAFAHQAAKDAMAEARRLDPNCAMCGWGDVWARGPTINYGVSDAEAAVLSKDILAAQALAKDGPPLERALIDAMVKRYPGTKVDAKAYAEAMDALATANPASDPIAVLAAEALMMAADDWTADTMARSVALLETVLARSPDYAPAIHFYIHATEGAGYADRALPYADRLAAIAPAASHLVHMPAHTFYWAGRYADAGTTNLRAVQINDANAVKAGKTDPGAAFGMGNYHWHNAFFGVGGALLAGDAETGLALARPMIAAARPVSGQPYVEIMAGNAFVAVARFAPLEEALALPNPGANKPIARVMWHYARGEAYSRAGNRAGVVAEITALRDYIPGDAGRFRRLTLLLLEGRLAMLSGKPAKAVSPLRKAAAIEEAKPFGKSSDPPIWWFPVRRSVAAALLQSGDAAGALAETDAVLKRRKGDPMTLAIRAAALTKLGRTEEAQRDLAAARKGWRGDPAMLAPPFA